MAINETTNSYHISTTCKLCRDNNYTYNGICNKCAWEQMNYYKATSDSFAQLIKQLTTNELVTNYEHDTLKQRKQA